MVYSTRCSQPCSKWVTVRVFCILFITSYSLYIFRWRCIISPLSLQNKDTSKRQKYHFISETKPDLVQINITTAPVPHVNCKAIANGDASEIKRGHEYQQKHPYFDTAVPDESFTSVASNCHEFIKSRQYVMEPLSQEEADFPLAFAVMAYKDMYQVDRLLRAIYRPQNHYCFHVDVKAHQVIKDAINNISACFDNVFVSSRSIDVAWGTFSVLKPELVCMEALWKYKWKYFINLTGQEFPLQSNWALVKILKAIKGANILEGTVKRRISYRTDFVHDGLITTEKRKSPPPIPVVLTHGAVHIIAKRAFVDYILHNKDALAFREWVKDTGHPEEIFFTSLNHSPKLNVPGAYKGDPESDHIDGKDPIYPFLGRFKNWGSWPYNWTCSGTWLRGVCVFGLGDLQLLVNRKELFANKFVADYQPLTYDCLEEIHFNRTRDEVLGLRKIDTSYYETLDLASNHV